MINQTKKGKRVVLVVLTALLIFVLNGVFDLPINRFLNKLLLVELNDDLCRSLSGHFGIKTEEGFFVYKVLIGNKKGSYDRLNLNDIIDIESFRRKSNSKYEDKDYVYYLQLDKHKLHYTLTTEPK